LLIVILSILSITLYELYTKKNGFIGNITVAFISSITFIFGGAAVGNPLSSLPITLLAFLIIFGREIIMDIRDIEGDKKFRQTLPNKIGIKKSSYISSILLILAIIFSPIPYILDLVNIWYFYIIIPTNILIFITIIWFLKDHKNAGLSAHIIRGALALGLIGFIFGII
jgi:geranylgeranylglycerol-phosphate geranylgeranyltransferase